MKVYKQCYRNNGSRSKVVEFENGTRCLISYNTCVACIKDGQFYRLWDGYSPTTMKHLWEFGCKANKHGWFEMEVHSLIDLIGFDDARKVFGLIHNDPCKYAWF